ncbi:hypothetical protein QYM36_007889 [Artemia franciscana]|uniref:Reverse transcriptase domain-containing protein n=1 Tax=Artemia franciscana TaxID=6661 RepID=A0AA88ITJ0_ARTSF|nr:hypothetical protein QYM36_007889 [Artemia franciscana]
MDAVTKVFAMIMIKSNPRKPTANLGERRHGSLIRGAVESLQALQPTVRVLGEETEPFSVESGVKKGVSDLDYADDIDALAADSVTAQAMLNEIAHFSQLLGMKINTAKTKVMDLNLQSDQLVLYGQESEKVDSLTYPGSVIDPLGG